MMAPQYSHGNAVAAIGIGIAITLVSVMAQSNKYSYSEDVICKLDQISRSRPKIYYVFAQNLSKVSSLTNTFPINTALLAVCKEREVNQFKPTATSDLLFGKCTARGWYNGNEEKWNPPPCVKRENHCGSPTARIPNTTIQIDGQNITDQNHISLNYSVGTTAIYKCKDPQKSDSQKWSCKKKEIGHMWEKNNETAADLVCEDGNDKSSTRITESFPTVIPATSITPASNPAHESHMNDNKRTPSDPGSSWLRDLLIGICSFLGFVMIAALFGILYKNRLGKRYNDTADHTRQPPFTSMPERETKSKEKFADGKENLLYANIIPIKVNQETIYAEIETGKIGKSRPITNKLTTDDDQLHTIYAEIHHSAIPKDQRR